MTLSPASPPPIESLSPDLQFKLWERDRNRLKRSWVFTLLLCSPALAFIFVKPVHDTIEKVYQGATFLHWLTGLVTLPQVGTGAATVPAGTAGLTAEQTTVAQKIIQAGLDRGLAQKDIKLGLMTAMQESSMKELDHGDDWYFAQWGEKSDSLGPFQQRERGWGSRECRIDATCSANWFYDALLKISDRHSMPEWKAIALVQRPAAQYEQHYQQWNEKADEILKSVQSAPAASSSLSGEVFPLSGFTVSDINSGYGMRINPVTGISAMHYGVDFPADVGVPIHATQSGKVIVAQKGNDGCGGQVEIQHSDGNGERICHASAVLVKVGDTVTAGQIIAEVGSTGRSTGPHLHFERIERGQSINPVPYLKSIGLPDTQAPQRDVIASAPVPTPTPAPLAAGSVPGIQFPDGGMCGSVAIALDRLVTAAHCVKSAEVTVVPPIGEWLKGQVIKQDNAIDLALIQVDGASFPVLPMGSPPAEGDSVTAIGYPTAHAGRLTVTPATVQAIEQNCGIQEKCFSVPTGILSPGFSGGAIVDGQGRLVGVNRAIGEANGTGYAIPIDIVQQFAQGN